MVALYPGFAAVGTVVAISVLATTVAIPPPVNIYKYLPKRPAPE